MLLCQEGFQDRRSKRFQQLIKTHPKSDKAAGAKLKIGYSYLNENNTAKAKEWLNRVVKEYRDTKEAELAKDKAA